MNINQFSDDAFAGYVAGLLDGEGCIEINPKVCNIRVRIANTFKPVLDGVHARLGYGKVESYPKRPTLPLFAYCTSNAHDSRELLRLCRPFLQIKAARADQAMVILESMAARQAIVEARDAEILAALANGETQTSIAKRLGVSQPFVSYAKIRQSKLIQAGRLNPRRSIKKNQTPSDALFFSLGRPLSLPCRQPSEASDQST